MSIIKSIQKNKKAFLVTVLQISLLLMLVSITVKELLGEIIFYLSQIALSFVFLKILFFDLLKEMKKEHKHFIYFFGPLYLIIQLSWIMLSFIRGTNNLLFFLAPVGLALLFVIFFKVFIGKNYVHGKVILSNKKFAVVQTEFDIRSFVTKGQHVVRTDKKIKEGKTVKIAFKSSFFGKKTAKII